MQNRYQVKFTLAAYNDMDGIYRYISDNLSAPQATKNLMDEIEKRVMSLKMYPYAFPAVLDELLKNKGYHKLVIHNYIVFYQVNEEEKNVRIMRVLFGPSQYEKNI